MVEQHWPSYGVAAMTALTAFGTDWPGSLCRADPRAPGIPLRDLDLVASASRRERPDAGPRLGARLVAAKTAVCVPCTLRLANHRSRLYGPIDGRLLQKFERRSLAAYSRRRLGALLRET